VQVVAARDADTQEQAAASAVAISDAVDGSCPTGLGGTGGRVPPMPDGEMPEGMPTDMPERGERPEGTPPDGPTGEPPEGMPEGGFGTSGLVSAVDDLTITVEVTSPDGSTGTATVTVDDATAYTRTATSDASAVAVGQCVLAQGEADDSGAVTATSVTVSTPGDDGCSSGWDPVRGPGGERRDGQGSASDDA